MLVNHCYIYYIFPFYVHHPWNSSFSFYFSLPLFSGCHKFNMGVATTCVTTLVLHQWIYNTGVATTRVSMLMLQRWELQHVFHLSIYYLENEMFFGDFVCLGPKMLLHQHCCSVFPHKVIVHMSQWKWWL